ncbi:unnamed protein product [Oikopleura dioica]|uniref:HNF-p1 domain-containing protein n=1 Tax=Oikopleura dioica TaxID=34765 RepID=E4Y167_OIKDI|nr:unnamed protein product [Oikopleura dioica]
MVQNYLDNNLKENSEQGLFVDTGYRTNFTLAQYMGQNGEMIYLTIEIAMRDLRFTVEQIWLLQRLRVSGLNREQIVAGLEDLDRLDGTCLFNANSDIAKSAENSDSEKTSKKKIKSKRLKIISKIENPPKKVIFKK